MDCTIYLCTVKGIYKSPIPLSIFHIWQLHKEKSRNNKWYILFFENCSDLLWEINVLIIEKNFHKFLRSLNQFIWTVKGKNNFWNRIIFLLVHWDFSDLIHWNKWDANWKKNNWDDETYRNKLQNNDVTNENLVYPLHIFLYSILHSCLNVCVMKISEKP